MYILPVLSYSVLAVLLGMVVLGVLTPYASASLFPATNTAASSKGKVNTKPLFSAGTLRRKVRRSYSADQCDGEIPLLIEKGRERKKGEINR